MKCIAIDDEPFALELIAGYIQKTPFLEFSGAFTNPLKALSFLMNNKVDLIFLDINMPDLSGIQLLKSLSNSPHVIFITAYSEFGAESYDYNAVDYLLKPVTYSRFCRAIDKAKRYYSRKDVNNSADNEIFIKSESSYIKIKLKDIICIEAFENNITLTTCDKKFDIHFTLKDLENQLPPEIFIRVHRSLIVNKRRIMTINEDSLDLVIGNTLKNFPVGRTFKDLLLNEIDVMAE